MTAPHDFEDLAAPYALHALSDAERDDVDARLSESEFAPQFYAEVRSIRETLAAVSAATALDPPAALRPRILAATGASTKKTGARPNRWRTALLAAAAAIVVAAGAVGIGLAVRPAPAPSVTQQIFAAPDVRTVSGEIPTGGTATVVYSRERDAALLVMNNVAPPSAGTVYQMWLVNGDQMTSAGTMDTAAVAPSTTAVLPDLHDSSELAFTVEPGTGSPQPTGAVFARLPLT